MKEVNDIEIAIFFSLFYSTSAAKHRVNKQLVSWQINRNGT
jgi:hypothetical protein